MKKLFGTDGIRGVVGSQEMNEALAVRVGKALVKYCRADNLEPVIIIGQDTRESGEALARAAYRGIAAAGGRAFFAGVIPTAAVAHLVKSNKAGLGLVISASHNPYEYNGLKVFNSQGEKLTTAEESNLEQLIVAENAETATEKMDFGKALVNDYNDKYLDFLLKAAGEEEFKDWRIVLDCANGATLGAAPRLFRKLGVEVIVASAAPDGRNINESCGSEHPEALIKMVVENKARMGLAFDGDGDRLVAVDETGARLTGDQLLYVFARWLKEKNELKNDLVVSTVMSNIGFINALKNLGIKYLATDVGDRQVYEAMKNNGAALGGEESGHIIFSDYHTTGDGILSGLILVKALKYFNRPLSELINDVKLAPKILINIKVTNKPELKTVPALNEAIKAAEKRLGEAGRVLVRYSGTEPLCRVMVEGKEENEIRELAEAIGRVIEQALN